MYYFKYYLYRWFILFSVMVLVTPSFLSLTPLYIDYWRSHPCWKKQILWCLWKIPHTGYSTHREYDTLSWGIVRVDRPWINRNWLGRHFLDMIVICMSCLENAERQSHWNKKKKIQHFFCSQASLNLIMALSEKEMIYSVSWLWPGTQGIWNLFLPPSITTTLWPWASCSLGMCLHFPFYSVYVTLL